MRVVMLSPEVYPYAKTGGLADVLAALPRALAAAGVEVTVCMPGYRPALRAAGALAPGTRLHAPIGSRMEPAEMVCAPGASVPTVLVRADQYFDRDGLYGVLPARHAALRGILNGIDDAVWNPATDPHLPARYRAGDLAGKVRCKRALQAELGLAVRDDAPLLGIVSRLAEQKGFDLLAAALPRALEPSDAELAVLGSGEERYERWLRELVARFPGRVGARVGFDEGLAHRIEAGADVFLMPSRFEPCGLNQLYSLRYGTVPIVHATGGLDDSVVEFDPATGAGTGFKFSPYTPEAFLAALACALRTRRDPVLWARLIANGMAQDFSWSRAAAEYRALYETLVAPAP